MKVLLVQDVEHLGKAGELKDVSGGFGRNYLLPKGFAVLATKGQVRQAEERMAAQRKRIELARKDAQALAARVDGATLRFEVRVGEQERLYGSVTSSDIAEKLKAQTGVEVDRRKIDLDETIKRTGTYPVVINFVSGVNATVNVIVEGEGGPAAAPAAADAAGSEEPAVPDLDDEETAS